MSRSRRLRLAVALGALLVLHGVGAAENSFARGDHIAFLVTEFKSVETAQDKSYSMIRGVTVTGREFSIEARWGVLTTCPDFLARWKATRRSAAEPYYIAGFLEAESPMVVTMGSCVRDPKSVDRSRKDIY
jgi:hypothetical protein